MQIKITMKYHYTSIKMAKNKPINKNQKNLAASSAGENAEK